MSYRRRIPTPLLPIREDGHILTIAQWRFRERTTDVSAVFGPLLQSITNMNYKLLAKIAEENSEILRIHRGLVTLAVRMGDLKMVELLHKFGNPEEMLLAAMRCNHVETAKLVMPLVKISPLWGRLILIAIKCGGGTEMLDFIATKDQEMAPYREHEWETMFYEANLCGNGQAGYWVVERVNKKICICCVSLTVWISGRVEFTNAVLKDYICPRSTCDRQPGSLITEDSSSSKCSCLPH